MPPTNPTAPRTPEPVAWQVDNALGFYLTKVEPKRPNATDKYTVTPLYAAAAPDPPQEG